MNHCTVETNSQENVYLITMILTFWSLRLTVIFSSYQHKLSVTVTCYLKWLLDIIQGWTPPPPTKKKIKRNENPTYLNAAIWNHSVRNALFTFKIQSIHLCFTWWMFLMSLSNEVWSLNIFLQNQEKKCQLFFFSEQQLLYMLPRYFVLF